jgi:hypothetical protein
MRRLQWGALSMSARVAAIAFGLHALLLAVDLGFFEGAYSGHPREVFWGALRILAFGLLMLSLLLGEPRTWLFGLMAFFGFMVGDLYRIGSLLARPTSPAGLIGLTVMLVLTLAVGIGACLWSGVTAYLRQPAA